MFTTNKAISNSANKTVIEAMNAADEKVLIEAVCLSTDSKPTDGIANGSLVIEMDTGKIYAFNEAGATWIELSA